MSNDAEIIQGDCLEVMATSVPESSIDVVLVDPPFSSGTRKEGSKGIRRSMVRSIEDSEWFGTDSQTTNGFVWLMRQNALRWKRLLKRGGHAFVFIDWRMYPHLSAAIESADFRHKGTLVWDKTYFGMGDCFRNQHEFILHFTSGMGRKASRADVGNVISCPPVRDGLHPNEKPVALLKNILSVVGREGDRVLDPFCGSGSTGVAAVQLGMSFVGIELDPEFVAMTERRLSTTPRPARGGASLFDHVDICKGA